MLCSAVRLSVFMTMYSHAYACIPEIIMRGAEYQELSHYLLRTFLVFEREEKLDCLSKAV